MKTQAPTKRPAPLKPGESVTEHGLVYSRPLSGGPVHVDLSPENLRAALQAEDERPMDDKMLSRIARGFW